jgi:hypothetical protein
VVGNLGSHGPIVNCAIGDSANPGSRGPQRTLIAQKKLDTLLEGNEVSR